SPEGAEDATARDSTAPAFRVNAACGEASRTRVLGWRRATIDSGAGGVTDVRNGLCDRPRGSGAGALAVRARAATQAGRADGPHARSPRGCRGWGGRVRDTTREGQAAGDSGDSPGDRRRDHPAAAG